MITKLISNQKISVKLWIGAGFFFLVLILVSILNVSGGQKTKTQIDHLLRLEPLAEKQVILQLNNEKTIASMGVFLMGLDSGAKTKFIASIEQADKSLQDIQREPALKALPKAELIIEDILAVQQQLNQYFSTLLTITEKPQQLIPGNIYSAETLAPKTNIILSNLSLMLNSEFELDSLEYSFYMEKKQRELSSLIFEMRHLWTLIGSDIRAYLSFRNDNIFEKLNTFGEQFNTLIDQLDTNEEFLGFEQQDSLSIIKENVTPFLAALPELKKIHSQRYWRTDMKIVATNVVPLFTKLDQLNSQLHQIIHDKMTGTQIATQFAADENISNTSIIVVTAIIIGLLINWLLIRLVTRPINRTVHAMTDIASGSGNLAHRLHAEGKDELAQLGSGFNVFVEKIKGVIDLVIASSISLAEESERMNAVTIKSRDGVTQQQNDIEQVTLSINELSKSTQAVANNASSAASAAQDASQTATEGQSVVSESVNAINSLADEINQVAAVVERVERESDEIGDVLSVIRSVSEQTNLLALNAAIEAARAGEHGRGFAVVADEVRSLSEQIQAQTDNIQNKIQALQSGSSQAVEAMKRGSEKTQRSVELANNAGQALEAINVSINTIAEVNGQIAQTTNEQSQTVSHIQQRTVAINEIATESAKTSDQAAASSHEFSIMANQLQDLVEQFLLEEESSHTDNKNSTQDQNSIQKNSSALDHNEIQDNNDVELF